MTIFAQRGNKIAYVDMDYILDKVPEYRQSQDQLDQRVQQWKTEIEKRNQKINDLKEELDSERPLLTPQLIEEMDDEIDYLEEQLLTYKNDKFGVEGKFITQKRQLIQPIQDQVFNAIQDIGESRNYDFIFENSADALMLFSAKRHDLSEVVLKMIQIKARGNQDTEEVLDDIDQYKSVEKAETDEKEEKERKEIQDKKEKEREEIISDRQRKMDSLRADRQRKFEERRQRILDQREERQRERDSIREARENN
ncbi:MAG: OmpH family outer membrane protein [Psychroflexus sp.]|nr:OmpH family outer membrane protein [Psychroflexus sp.]MDN6309851.1 OmpH family outer membrane protein [Psychroflexus sp.]